MWAQKIIELKYSFVPKSIPQKPEYNNWTIAGGENITWDQAKVPGPNNVIIEDGCTLTVKSSVYFNAGVRLTVEQGGKLIVEEGGRLTSNCNDPWYGVEVWGTPTAGQNPLDQGWVLIRNGQVI